MNVPLGQVVITPGAQALDPALLLTCLCRHARGDWGCVDPDDQAENHRALQAGDRLLSAYPIDERQPCRGYGDNCLWIITEWDRSVTTLLLPEEY